MDRNIGKIIRITMASKAVALLLLGTSLYSCTNELSESELWSDSNSLEVRITFPENQKLKVTKTNLQISDSESTNENLTFWTTDATIPSTRATDSGSEEERKIDKITLLVFNADGSKLENVQIVDLTSANTTLSYDQPQWERDRTLIIKSIDSQDSPKKIYAVANWNKIDFDKDVYTETMLKEELSTITVVESIATPLLMSGSESIENLRESLSKVTIELQRQVAKIDMAITVDETVTQAAIPDVEWLTNKVRIMVGNVSDRSYMIGRSPAIHPADCNFLTSEFINVPQSGAAKWDYDLYIHENPIKGNGAALLDKAIFVMIQLPYKDRKTNIEEYDNYYKVYIDNKSNFTNPYEVLRNTIYALNIKIVGLGLPITDLIANGNIEENLLAVPWNDDVNISDLPPMLKYFNISNNRIEFQCDEKLRKAAISTNISDWKLIGEDGSTIFSYNEGKIAPVNMVRGVVYSISGNANMATITVERDSKTTTFDEQKMKFIAQNIEVPFIISDDNGIIPNSVLEAAGWHALASERPRGVQVSKTGNILPSKMAIDVDTYLYSFTHYWKMLDYYPHYLTGTGYGYGKIHSSNKETVTWKGFKYCKDLGHGWYLPSLDELSLIIANKTVLGKSYEFVERATSYWSSSWIGDWSSKSQSKVWAVQRDGVAKMVYMLNTQDAMSRCVRDI